MNLLDGLEKMATLFLPGIRRIKGEHEALRQMYDTKNTGLVIPGTVATLRSPASGALVGFQYRCTCGLDMKILSSVDWERDFNCGQCGVVFNVFKKLGILDSEGRYKVTSREKEEIIARLPVRPNVTSQSLQPPIVSTWPEDQNAGGYKYNGTDGRYGRSEQQIEDDAFALMNGDPGRSRFGSF